MDIKSIIYITEENVDGCGSNASDLYGINHALTEEERAQLANALAETKKNADEDNCLSTGDMIEIAMDATFGAGNWKLIPYQEVSF